MPRTKAPLGDCTDDLVDSAEFGAAGRDRMRAVRMDHPDPVNNTTQVVYFLLPPGAVEDRPATVPEGATYWLKKKNALNASRHGSRWSAQPDGDQRGQGSRRGQELAHAMAIAFLGRASTNPCISSAAGGVFPAAKTGQP